MTSKKNSLILIGLVFALIVAFGLHVYMHSVYGYALFGSFIIASYLFNLGYVLFEVWLLNRRRLKQGANLGNAYLVMSMLKFLIFFSVFLPLFKMDGTQDRFEFFGFFIPYAICLVAGTTILVQILNATDQK